MPQFRIYHQAPGGPKMYHYGMAATISTDPEDGKIYGSKTSTEEEDKKQLNDCRKNFEYVFNNAGKPGMLNANASYATQHWNGHGLDEIVSKIEYLETPVDVSLVFLSGKYGKSD